MDWPVCKLQVCIFVLIEFAQPEWQNIFHVKCQKLFTFANEYRLLFRLLSLQKKRLLIKKRLEKKIIKIQDSQFRNRLPRSHEQDNPCENSSHPTEKQKSLLCTYLFLLVSFIRSEKGDISCISMPFPEKDILLFPRTSEEQIKCKISNTNIQQQLDK